MKFFRILIIFFILSIGFFLRIWHIKESAANIGFDEAALGYNAYSLMLTGKDEHAFKYPISLKSFGDYKPAMYTYLTIPFIKIFGLTNLSLRMVSAISGVVLAYFVYLILGIYVKDENTGLPVDLGGDAAMVTSFFPRPWKLICQQLFILWNLFLFEE